MTSNSVLLLFWAYVRIRVRHGDLKSARALRADVDLPVTALGQDEMEFALPELGVYELIAVELATGDVCAIAH